MMYSQHEHQHFLYGGSGAANVYNDPTNMALSDDVPPPPGTGGGNKNTNNTFSSSPSAAANSSAAQQPTVGYGAPPPQQQRPAMHLAAKLSLVEQAKGRQYNPQAHYDRQTAAPGAPQIPLQRPAYIQEMGNTQTSQHNALLVKSPSLSNTVGALSSSSNFVDTNPTNFFSATGSAPPTPLDNSATFNTTDRSVPPPANSPQKTPPQQQQQQQQAVSYQQQRVAQQQQQQPTPPQQQGQQPKKMPQKMPPPQQGPSKQPAPAPVKQKLGPQPQQQQHQGPAPALQQQQPAPPQQPAGKWPTGQPQPQQLEQKQSPPPFVATVAVPDAIINGGGDATATHINRPIRHFQSNNSGASNYRPTYNVSEEEITVWFMSIDENNNGTISPEELQMALSNNKINFSPEMAKRLVRLFRSKTNATDSLGVFSPPRHQQTSQNSGGSNGGSSFASPDSPALSPSGNFPQVPEELQDQSLCLNLSAFKRVHRFIFDLSADFKAHDAGHKGYLEAAELSNALSEWGYNFSPTTMGVVMKRFDSRGAGVIMLDNFIDLFITLSLSRNVFAFHDRNRTGNVVFNFDTFFNAVVVSR